MKRTLLLFLLFLCVHAFAQTTGNDPKATKILNGVSSKYKSLKAVKADFILKIQDADGKAIDSQSGSLIVKGNKYRLQLKNQEITSDNTTVWTYLKDANEVQVNSYDPDAGSISPSDIFTIYEKDFLYAFTGEKTVNGKVIQYIELTPHDKSKPYFKIRIGIDKAAKAVQSALVFDKNGNRYTYEIRSFKPDPDINDAFFSFDSKAHPGVEVVDLR